MKLDPAFMRWARKSSRRRDVLRVELEPANLAKAVSSQPDGKTFITDGPFNRKGPSSPRRIAPILRQ